MRSAMANSQNRAAINSVTPTAADPMSFTCMIRGSRSVVSRSASFSIAVLSSSTTRISATAQISSTRRMTVAPTSQAAGIDSSSAISSSRIACSERTAKTRPLRELIVARQSRSKSKSRRRRDRLDLAATLPLEQLRDQERHVDRLLGIETGIADRVITVVEILVGNRACPANAFGDVLAGHLQMHPAGIGALRRVDRKEAPHLRQDAVERPGLVASGRGDGIAVHRIARPHHDPSLAFHRAKQSRQLFGDLVGAEPGNQRQPSRLVVGIEQVDQLDQLVRLHRRAAFQADRILDAAKIFDVSVVELPRAVADPDEMARRRIPVAGRGIDAGESLLIAEQQRFMAGVEIGRAQLGMALEIEAAGADRKSVVQGKSVDL